MPFYIVNGDITAMNTDAIVNAANESLLGGGGVDGCIHRAAGEKLLKECKKIAPCKTGQAKLTKGYLLPCKYVIHTVGPVWHGGGYGEKELLIQCYVNSLKLAKDKDCKTVAFPLISSGVYGYPKDEALEVAKRSILGFLEENEMTVFLVIYDKASFRINKSVFDSISDYISSVDINTNKKFRLARDTISYAVCECNSNISDALENLDESFSQMLLRKIDESGMTDSQCYKKANVDRKLFSKIRSDKDYKPSKTTAIAFALALELSLEETEDMLKKAGYALSHSNKFDIIIEYFIKNGVYDVFEINEALFAFDQKLLGA